MSDERTTCLACGHDDESTNCLCSYADRVAAWQRTIAALRFEYETFQQLVNVQASAAAETIAALRAEVERLRLGIDYAKEYMVMPGDVSDMKAEIERLKEENENLKDAFKDSVTLFGDEADIARNAALGAGVRELVKEFETIAITQWRIGATVRWDIVDIEADHDVDADSLDAAVAAAVAAMREAK